MRDEASRNLPAACARLAVEASHARSWSTRCRVFLLLLAVLCPRDVAQAAGPYRSGAAPCAKRTPEASRLFHIQALRMDFFRARPCREADSGAKHSAWLRVEGSLHVLDSYLAARLTGLEARSQRLHQAMDRIRSGGLPVYIGTPEQIAAYHASTRVLGDRLTREERIAEMAAVLESAHSERFLFGVVRIDLARVAERRTGHAYDAEVDAILIHEVWGHLVPVAENPVRSAMCRDPRPGEPVLDACAMRRENDLRRELGLAPRKTYPL
jgi:hypothetical protein